MTNVEWDVKPQLNQSISWVDLGPHVGGVAQWLGGVRRVNEVNPRRARLVLGRVTVFGM